ncbi:MAG: hypothetical protein D6824_00740 [Planctomycetota bacterium]|nr:MAG: hypothetical protein D6824_00740 [Planctomycetota bacterium]
MSATQEQASAAAALGVLLLGAWLAGRLFKTMHLPSVSGYLVLGLLVGPGALGLITKSQLQMMSLANDLAIALIALTAGGEIRWQFLRGEARLIGFVTAFQAVVVTVGVGAVMYGLIPAFGLVQGEMAPGALWRVAMLCGVIGVASSPAVVVAVIAEMRAVNAFAQRAVSVAVCKDLALVAMFTVAIAVSLDAPLSVDAVQSASHTASPVWATASTASLGGDGGVFLEVGRKIFGSIAAGGAVGLLLAWWMRALSANMPLFLVLGGFGVAIGAEALGLEPLIVGLVAGMLMENVWGRLSEALFEAIEDLSLPVFCVFFAATGAKVDLQSLWASAPATLAIVGTRAALVWGATAAGIRAAGAAGRGLWTAFVPQAGVSLALLAIIDEKLGEELDVSGLIAAMLGAVAVHEIAGPVLFRAALARSLRNENAQETAQDEGEEVVEAEAGRSATGPE